MEYKNFKAMIHQKAIKFSKKYAVELEEMLSEANEIFVIATATHNSARAQFSTHLYLQLESRLNTFGKNEITRKNKELVSQKVAVDYNRAVYVDPAFSSIEFDELIASTEETEKEIFKYIFETKEKRITQNSIRKHFISDGWKRCQIDRSLNLIKEELNASKR